MLQAELDPISLRKLLLQADVLNDDALSRWAESAPLPSRHPLRLIGALIKRRKLNGTVRPPQSATAFADFDRRLDWLRFTAAPDAMPGTLASGIELTLMKVAYIREYHAAGLIDDALQTARETGALIRTVRHKVYGSQARGFTSNWTQAIGHMVVFIHMLAARRFGLADWDRTLLEGGRIANRPLQALAQAEYGPVLTLSGRKGFFEPHGAMLPEEIGGEAVDVFEFCRRVDREAETRGTTILPLPPRAGALEDYLSSQGLGPDDRYVTLHCREEGFKLRRAHDLRNATIANYVPALEYLTQRGFTVIRLGDASMAPLPAVDGVIDYARGPDKNPELDILLPAHAAFHIGASSGLSLVPLLFGRPCLFLNWYPTILLPWGRSTWTLLKRLVRLDDGACVTDPDTLFTMGMISDEEMLTHLGFELEENTPNEILDTVQNYVRMMENRAISHSPNHFLYDPAQGRVAVRGHQIQ